MNISRFPALHAFLTGDTSERETPPCDRRGSPNHGLNVEEDKTTMTASAARGNAAKTPSTTLFATPPLSEIIRSGRMNIQPALARRILDEANYDRQRGVYKSSLRDAEVLIKSDDWIDNYQIWFALVDGALFLIDGQHRLSGIWTTGIARTFQVEVLDCATIEDAHRLYASMDRFGRKRTDSEMLTAMHFAEDLGVGKLMAKAAWKCAPYIHDDFRSGRYGRSASLPGDRERIEFLRPWAPLIKRYDEMVSFAETDLHRALINPGIVAVGLVTLAGQPIKAKEFWEGVAMDDGLRRGDPRHTFIVALRNRAFNRNGQDGVKTAAVAWNAHYEGRKISFIRIGDNAEVRIAGVRRAK